MRFVASRHLQSFRLLATMPEPFSVKAVGTQWKVTFHGAEAERLVRFKQINARRNNLSGVGPLDYDFQVR